MNIPLGGPAFFLAARSLPFTPRAGGMQGTTRLIGQTLGAGLAAVISLFRSTSRR